MYKIVGKLDSVKVVSLWENSKDIFSDNMLDLTEVSEIDSSGVAFLVAWSKQLSGNKLAIQTKNHILDNWIRLFKIAELFNIENVDN